MVMVRVRLQEINVMCVCMCVGLALGVRIVFQVIQHSYNRAHLHFYSGGM